MIAATPAMMPHINNEAVPAIKMPVPGGNGRCARECATATRSIERILIPIAPAEARLIVMTVFNFPNNDDDDKDFFTDSRAFLVLARAALQH